MAMSDESFKESFIAARFKEAVDAFHDAFGVVRRGREADYRHGRWCPRCHNSLPADWTGPCDVCGG